jgi:uncharacterized repeat protein (TIGR01451 family)
LALLLSVLLLVQYVSAQGPDAEPTPPSTNEEDPSFADVAPTDAELLAMPDTLERYIAAHTLPAGVLRPANLNPSTKTASDNSVAPGGVFEYTITIENSGDFDIPATMTDELPSDVTYIDQTCVAFITDRCNYEAGEVTWEGTVTEGGSATITITVRMKANAEPDSTVTNTARIVSAEQDIERSAEVTVGQEAASPIQYVPFTLYGILPDPGPVTLAAGQPNSANTWNLSWTASVGASGYEIHESNTADFANATPTIVGPQTALAVTKTPSPFNVYYYRVRSLVGQNTGPWSNVVSVVGGYRDDFDNSATGWSIRRSTYLEEVEGFYESGRYVMQVNSRWDWGIASPLRPAPRVPYVIDFEARIASLGYAHSAGAVFGGDWPGETCPPGTSFDEWYKHDKCFNHFYNTNSIYNDTNPSDVEIALLFERIDRLEWCLGCGGSPMKRLGDISDLRAYRDIDPKEWNHYRIEVRPNSIKVYAGRVGQTPTLQYEYTDTRWISSPYFGLFASTDVIENATWRFEYMQVMPLD